LGAHGNLALDLKGLPLNLKPLKRATLVFPENS
jgi:hypothetical protein